MAKSLISKKEIRQGINTPEANGVIRTSETVVNPIYARGVKPHLVRDIVNEFDPRMIGTIIVCDIGDDKYEIIDGQHRVEACKQLKHEWIEVVVFYNMSLEERSRFYTSYNVNRQALTSIEKFKAKVVSGDDDSVVIHQLCRTVGVLIAGIDTGNKQTLFPITGAIGGITKIYHMGVLSSTLQAIYHAYIDEDIEFSTQAFGSYILDNVSKVLFAYRDEIDLERLVSTISGTKAKTWNSRYDTTDLQLKTYGGALRIVEAYNKGLSEINRLDASRLFLKKATNVYKRKSMGIDKG
jgi:hypothetical protein